ncbi:MAG TPA: hypothetical protein VHQ47_17725 [Phycisphaerae bacterium]|nr:hypothetical protein [Phycisphaerae bacterium]
MTFLLGQAAEQSGKDWTSLIAFVAVLQLIQTVFAPMIGVYMKQIFSRLRDGDEKFEEQGKALTRVETTVEGFARDMRDMKQDSAKSNERQLDIKVEGLGAITEARIEMRKEFVTRDEFLRHQERAEERHSQILEAIHELGRQR